MKGLKYLFLCLSLLIVAGACEDIEEPFVEFDDLEKGAFARLTDGVNGAFNLFDPANSSINFTVEFYDENDGNNVEQYAWTVAYDDRSDADNDLPAVALRTFGKGDFSPNDRGLPSMSATFTFQEVLDALGLTADDVNGGDTFILNATITKTDGSTFDANNTGANVIGQNTFNALFQIRQNVVCLFEDETLFTGEYTLTQTSPPGPNGPVFGEDPLTVTITATGPTQRSFDYVYLPDLGIGNGAVDFAFDLVCGNVVVDPEQNSGLQCDAGIFMGPADETGNFDSADDSSFTIVFTEDVTEDCGTSTVTTIMLTKN